MIVIACVDDNNGMLFHQRRQSRDIALYNHILQLTEGKRLLMNEYSAKQFLKEEHQNVIVQSNFLDIAINKYIWKLQKVSDIKGNSHDMITEEVYTNV